MVNLAIEEFFPLEEREEKTLSRTGSDPYVPREDCIAGLCKVFPQASTFIRCLDIGKISGNHL